MFGKSDFISKCFITDFTFEQYFFVWVNFFQVIFQKWNRIKCFVAEFTFVIALITYSKMKLFDMLKELPVGCKNTIAMFTVMFFFFFMDKFYLHMRIFREVNSDSTNFFVKLISRKNVHTTSGTFTFDFGARSTTSGNDSIGTIRPRAPSRIRICG